MDAMRPIAGSLNDSPKASSNNFIQYFQDINEEDSRVMNTQNNVTL